MWTHAATAQHAFVKKKKKRKQEKKEYSLGGRGLTHLPESLSTVYKYIKGAYSEPT